MDTKQMLEIAEAVKADAGVLQHTVLPDADWGMGSSVVALKTLEAPTGATPEGLAVLAHEAGHIATTDPMQPTYRHFGLIAGTPAEFEATSWALSHLRAHGLRTDTEFEAPLREALGTYVAVDKHDGWPVSPEALAFVEGRLDL